LYALDSDSQVIRSGVGDCHRATGIMARVRRFPGRCKSDLRGGCGSFLTLACCCRTPVV